MTIFEDLNITGKIVFVSGKKDNQEICLFTLSTWQWCKKGRQWLQMND